MKRMLILVAVAVAIAASNSTASAQGPPPGFGGPPPGYGGPPPGYGGPPPGYGYDPAVAAYQSQAVVARDRYGINPVLRHLFPGKGCGKGCGSGCNTCGRTSAVYKHNHYTLPPPVASGGTLAFPHQPFTRSPRDFFEK